MLLSGPVLADNFCAIAGDPQLSFPGTSNPEVFAVMPDSNGDGGFGISLCSPGDLNISWLTSYSFGDLNHDGFEDLMFGRTSTNSGGEIKLFLNDKTGSGITVLSSTLHTGAAAPPTAVDALDLDGDGWDDILTANGSDGTFSVMLNDGTGAFPSVQQYPAGSEVTLLTAVDLNGDGFPDVVSESAADETISVSLNNGDGTFATPAVYSVGKQAGSFSIVDVNGDGHPDILVTTNVIDSLTELGSSSGATLRLTNNGDGSFSVGNWVSNSTYSGSGSLNLSGSGADLTISANGFALLTAENGAEPPIESGSISVASGTGKITTPTAVRVTVTKTSGSSTGMGGSSAASDPSASSGGGDMEWLSLMLLGLASVLRRKRA
jgi:hypothetical protein